MRVLLPQPHHLLLSTHFHPPCCDPLCLLTPRSFSLCTPLLSKLQFSCLGLPRSLRTGHQTSFTLKENLHLLSSCNISYWHAPGKLTSCFHTRSNCTFGCCLMYPKLASKSSTSRLSLPSKCWITAYATTSDRSRVFKTHNKHFHHWFVPWPIPLWKLEGKILPPSVPLTPNDKFGTWQKFNECFVTMNKWMNILKCRVQRMY